jgi:hypothetical protein
VLRARNLMFLMIITLLPGTVFAANPERLFDGYWSTDCAGQVEVETSEYSTFEQTAWCSYYVDDFRVQQNCQDVAYKKLRSNRVGMTTGVERFIVEFLSPNQISIMRLLGDSPINLEQVDSFGRAIFRDGLKTHHLYCP